jgi:hypothetical protein
VCYCAAVGLIAVSTLQTYARHVKNLITKGNHLCALQLGAALLDVGTHERIRQSDYNIQAHHAPFCGLQKFLGFLGGECAPPSKRRSMVRSDRTAQREPRSDATWECGGTPDEQLLAIGVHLAMP